MHHPAEIACVALGPERAASYSRGRQSTDSRDSEIVVSADRGDMNLGVRDATLRRCRPWRGLGLC